MAEQRGYSIRGNTPEEFFVKLSKNKYAERIHGEAGLFIFYFNESVLKLDLLKRTESLDIYAKSIGKIRETKSKLEKSLKVKLNLS